MEIHSIKKHKGEFFRILAKTDRSQVGVMTIAPGKDSGPEEIHDADQIIYVVEGEMEVEVNREKAIMREGDVAIIPKGVQHHIWNHGKTSLFFLTIYAPPEY